MSARLPDVQPVVDEPTLFEFTGPVVPVQGPAAAPAVPVQVPSPRPPAPVPVDRDVQAVLDALNADPATVEDRRKVVRAVLLEARARGGQVDPNRVRARLAKPSGHPDLSKPQVVGAVYNALTRLGVLQFVGYVQSTDRASGNAGRPARAYRLVRVPDARQL